MKKSRIISLITVFALLFSFTGCDKANKQCTETGNELMQALIDHKDKDIKKLCKDKDSAEALLLQYGDNDVVELFLEKATFEAGDAECSTKDGSGTVEYKLTLPDIEDAYDENPADMEELEELIDTINTTDITVKVKFKLKGDDWTVTNIDSILEKTYGYLYSYDFGFIDYDEVVSSNDWYNAEDGVYSGFSSYIEYIVSFNTSVDMDYTYQLSYNDEIIDSGEFYGPRTEIDVYYSAYDMDLSKMPAGTYSLEIADSHNRVVFIDSCEVAEVTYADYISSDNWYNSDEEPNIYNYNASYIDYDLYFVEGLNMDLDYEYYYNGTLVKSDTYYCGSYGYFYLYDDDLVDAGVTTSYNFFPAGTYEVRIYDGAGELITTASAIVNAPEVPNAVVESTNWYAADESPNIYDADTSYLDFDFYFEDYYGMPITFTYSYNGNDVYTGSYSCGSYAYCYFYLSDATEAGLDTSNGFPVGTYDIHVYDMNGNEIVSDSCVVR